MMATFIAYLSAVLLVVLDALNLFRLRRGGYKKLPITDLLTETLLTFVIMIRLDVISMSILALLCIATIIYYLVTLMKD